MMISVPAEKGERENEQHFYLVAYGFSAYR